MGCSLGRTCINLNNKKEKSELDLKDIINTGIQNSINRTEELNESHAYFRNRKKHQDKNKNSHVTFDKLNMNSEIYSKKKIKNILFASSHGTKNYYNSAKNTSYFRPLIRMKSLPDMKTSLSISPELIIKLSNFKSKTNEVIDTISIRKGRMSSNLYKNITKTEKNFRFSFGKNSTNLQDTNNIVNNNEYSPISPSIVDYNIDDKNINSRQFDIIYQEVEEKYYIEDQKEGTGLFFKINNKIEIRNGFNIVISFSGFRVKIETIKEISNNISNGNKNKDSKGEILLTVENPYIHKKFDKNNKFIKLGRSKGADIILPFKFLSRVEFTLFWKDNYWVLYDGNFDGDNKQKYSTNGIWMQIIDKIEIENGMLFKTGNIYLDTTIN